MDEPNQAQQENRKPGGLRQFFTLGEVGRYFFRKKDPNRPANINIRIMHGINKIAIVIFLLGILYIVIKRFFL